MSEEVKTNAETPSSKKIEAVQDKGITILPECFFCRVKTKDIHLIKNKWACIKCQIMFNYLSE